MECRLHAVHKNAGSPPTQYGADARSDAAFTNAFTNASTNAVISGGDPPIDAPDVSRAGTFIATSLARRALTAAL